MQRVGWKPKARALLKRLPGDGKLLRTGYRKFRLMRLNMRTKVGGWRGDALANPETVYWIDPARIVFYTDLSLDGPADTVAAEKRWEQQKFSDMVFDRDSDKGTVVSGEWDLSTLRFDSLLIYKAIEQRIQEKAEWQDTEFFRSMTQRLAAGESAWGCSTENDLHDRCAYVDRLIKSISENGYQETCDVSIEGDNPDSVSKSRELAAEILVNVGRDGQYLFQDGRHRLSIAKILKLDSVPVKVLVRSDKWQDLRNLLSSMVTSSTGASKKGVLYQSPIHPDLSDFPATHACEDRFDRLAPYMDGNGGHLLDVGANLGYFSHRGEELGYSCHAIELLPEVAKAADHIRVSEGKAFKIYEGDLFETFAKNNLHELEYEVVVALNILHHLLLTKDRYDGLIDWLGKLKVKKMLLETHRTDEHHMQNAYSNLEPEDFVQLILDHTPLAKSEFIDTADDGRRIFVLTT